MSIKDLSLSGVCLPEFEKVKKTFVNNFAEHNELGAACCLYVNGECVVDLWGGWANSDKTKMWQRDTLAGFYSVGKAMVTICALHACDQNSIDLDAPLTNVWPEYGQKGKSQTTLRHLLTHSAGMPAIRERLPDEALFDWTRMLDSLAAQEPYWSPGTRHGYHTNTYGLLAGEFVRRVSGLSVGQYLREHISGPLLADVYIGVGDADLGRCAETDWPQIEEILASLDLDSAMNEYSKMRLHAYANPMGISSVGVLNTKEWRRSELPSANGYGTAKGIARIFNALANDGESEDCRILESKTLKEAYRLQREGEDYMLQKDMRWGLGFQLTHPNRLLGPNPSSFGHFGNGGSVGFADSDAKVAFGYTMNRIVRNWSSPQNRALIDAVYQCLA